MLKILSLARAIPQVKRFDIDTFHIISFWILIRYPHKVVWGLIDNTDIMNELGIVNAMDIILLKLFS